MILIIKHVSIEGPGTISAFLEKQEFATGFVDFQKGDALPDCLDTIGGVIVLGGPMNVYEDEKYPFLNEEDAFIKKIIAQGIPLLGVCLGAQLIAKAAGAAVRTKNFKEIGWHPVTITPAGRQDFMFEGMGEKIEVFQWHEDAFEIPAGATLLAESAKCPQAFRLGECTYAFQFHFEVTPAMITEWLNRYSDDESIAKDPSCTQAMIQHAHEHYDGYEQQAKIILLRFCDLIRLREWSAV